MPHGSQWTPEGVTYVWGEPPEPGFNLHLTADKPSIQLKLSGLDSLGQHAIANVAFHTELWAMIDEGETAEVTLTGPGFTSTHTYTQTNGQYGNVWGSGMHEHDELIVNLSVSGLETGESLYFFMADITLDPPPPVPLVTIEPLADGSEQPDPAFPNDGPKPVEFRVSRSGDTSSGLRVYYHVEDITTTTGDDYEDPGTSIVVPPGAGSTVLKIVPKDDAVDEELEELQVVLDPDPAQTYVFANPANPPRSQGGIEGAETTPEYELSVTIPTITTGETEQAIATVTDASGNPMEGVTVEIQEHDGEYIQPQQMSQTTDANGRAVFDLKGLKENIAGAHLKFALGEEPLPFREVLVGIINPKLTLILDRQVIWVGQQLNATIGLTTHDGRPLAGKRVTISAPGINFPQGGVTTDAQGSGWTFGFADQSFPNAVDVTARYELEPGLAIEKSLQLEIKKITLQIVPPNPTLDLGANAAFDTSKFMAVRAVDAVTGQAIPGVMVDAYVSNANLRLQGDDLATTDNNGWCQFLIVAQAKGTAKFIVSASEEAEAETTVTIVD